MWIKQNLALVNTWLPGWQFTSYKHGKKGAFSTIA